MFDVREVLRDAVKNAICFECYLPHKGSGIECSCLSTKNDTCFHNDDPMKVANVIYNGIVEFAVNEFKIDYEHLDLEQRKAIVRYIKYDPKASQPTKLKYGFYGEVLLDLILRCYMKTSVLIARGYFYSVLEKGEPKGFDAFHIIEKPDNKIELWFGEAKFHQDYKQAISQVLKKIKISLSDEYINDNLIALIDWQDRFTTPNSKIGEILATWEENPDINLADEMNKHNMLLVYPIFIAFQKINDGCYHENIRECIAFILKEFTRLNIKISASFEYKIFFMFLPLSEVRNIKESVITWIESQEPLI